MKHFEDLGMQGEDRDGLLAHFRTALSCAQIDPDALIREAREIVVFGSRAVGVHSPCSDLDVLTITDQKQRVSSALLDCVVLRAEDLNTPFWLGSELAAHIVRYGCWLKGAGEWRNSVYISDRAISRKKRRISALARNADRRWCRLHPVFRTEYAVTIRRELQRLDLLLKGVAVPPTPILDGCRVERTTLPTRVLELAESLEVPIPEQLKGCL